jgi:two-component system LytT family sensor kinase
VHAIVTTGSFLPGDLIVYITSLLITVVLLVLTLRAARLPGTPLANVVFALSALLWSAGALARAALVASGLPAGDRWVLMAQALHFTGAGAFPIAILAIWRPFAVGAWQKTAARLVLAGACLNAAAVAALFWSNALWSTAGSGPHPIELDTAGTITASTAALLLILGAVACLRRDSTPRSVYLPSLTIVIAVCGASAALAIARYSPHGRHAAAQFAGIGAHLVLVLMLGAFLLFARFRYSDLFLRHGIRILLTGVWAGVLTYVVQAPFLWHMGRDAATGRVVHVLVIMFLANGVLLSFTFVDSRLTALVNRWLFRTTDYRAATRRLNNQLRDLQTDQQIAAAVEDAARQPLELSGARLIPIDTLPSSQWPAGTLEGEIVELNRSDPLRSAVPLANVEILVPVTSGGRVTQVLLVAQGSTRPGLVTHELNYLRMVAAHAGNRFDELRREREAAERQSREAVLLQQVTEAELRALRAQINPHFLFNSLNTIADLIVRDPPRAEAMTLRLASVFRHVLAHSFRALTTLRDEIEFLRTYLYIEEVRFGDRLQVAIDMAPELAGQAIPSLILQPLVENALKHGLGPKPGPGHLWIAARADGDRVRISIEDDGMGSTRVNGEEPRGLGLTNVVERLHTLYDDRAALTIEPREGGGTRVTVLIPRAPLEQIR